MLENDSLIIKDDTWLLNALMRWYKNEIRMREECSSEDKDDFIVEFKRLVLKSINIDNLRMSEIENEIFKELKIIEMSDYLEEMNYKSKYRYLNEYSIGDERVEEIVLKYYKNEEDEIIKEEDLRELKNENVVSTLFSNTDIKMRIIGLLIMIESGIDYKSIFNYLLY